MPAVLHFAPWGRPVQPCWHCTRFGGLLAEGAAARCTLAQGPRVRALPAAGCSAFEREPGSDDEPGQVPAVSADVVAGASARGAALRP